MARIPSFLGRPRRFRRNTLAAAFALSAGLALSACPAPPGQVEAPTHPLATAAPTASTVAAVADAGSDAAASPPAPPAIPDFAFSSRKKVGANACEAAEDTLARAAKEVLAQTASPRVASHPWNRQQAPEHLKRLRERYALTAAELALLNKNGFVVADRLEQPGFTRAFHDIHQSQLPVYVSADAIFHAVFRGHERIVASVETDLAERLQHTLGKMRAALPGAASALPREVAEDLDVYLTVAQSLIDDEYRPSQLGQDAVAKPLVGDAQSASGGMKQVTLFGRPRIIDFSQFAPRSYYASYADGALKPYFRAAMWLSRLEFNLVSRASRSSQPGFTPNPAETPREAVVAMALAQLAKQAGVMDDVKLLDDAWLAVAGKREDVSVQQLLALQQKARVTKLTIPDSADALRKAIGSDFQRTGRVHYMPQGSWPLPTIATFLGPRILPDTVALTHVVHADVDSRDTPHFGDIGFLLGHERANRYLQRDFAHFTTLKAKLEQGRSTLSQEVAPGMFGAWLEAARRLSIEPTGQVASFTKTDAFRDARLASAIAAYGQLRHGAVLMAGEPYSEGGCEIPDGYVDPVPDVYAMLREYAKRGRDFATRVGNTDAVQHFDRVSGVMSVLQRIAEHELAGQALSDAEKRWLAMIVEITPPSSDSPGSYDGWYFDLFPDIDSAFEQEAFVADWFTGANTGAVMSVAARPPRLGLFVVDVNGPPRVFVGPMASPFEHRGSVRRRLTDADVAKVKQRNAPWEASYVAKAPHAPALQVVSLGVETNGDRAVQALGIASSKEGVIELLNHHREVMASARIPAHGTFSLVKVAIPGDETPERVRVRVGDYSWEGGSEIYAGIVFHDSKQGNVMDYERAWKLKESLTQRLLNPPMPSAHRGSM
ncbi:MAG: DUF3160 domain-containing protein [Polyangiaceae bacterium]